MDIELVKKKLEGVTDWREFYLHEVGEMLECAMEHIAKLEAVQQSVQLTGFGCPHCMMDAAKTPDGKCSLCGEPRN